MPPSARSTSPKDLGAPDLYGGGASSSPTGGAIGTSGADGISGASGTFETGIDERPSS